MNLRYISVGVLAVIIALFYFMHQSNEASAERLKQAEISNQQRLEQEKIATKREQEEARKLAEKEARESTKTPQSSGAESSVSMSFSDCKRILEYDELGKTYINVPVWIDASSVRYNAIAYTYIPLDSEILGLSATRLPLDGRVPIFRVGDIGIISASKAYELPNHIAGQTYSLADQRISWCELEDSAGSKVPYDMYVVDYDYGKFTLNGDFALGALAPPLKAKYRYQDMGLIRDVQINGQITFTKPVTHNYSAEDSIVGSALVIGDMQARYTRKFVQPTWSNLWADEATGGAISANYNDSLYPILTTNNGAIQERWALVFTDPTNFRCVGEYSGQIGQGTVNTDFSPINPVTGAPYFTVKKEGWGAGWASGNVLRFNSIAATYPVWVIRTVKQSEPTVLSDSFQIMLRGDIDRVA